MSATNTWCLGTWGLGQGIRQKGDTGRDGQAGHPPFWPNGGGVGVATVVVAAAAAALGAMRAVGDQMSSKICCMHNDAVCCISARCRRCFVKLSMCACSKHSNNNRKQQQHRPMLKTNIKQRNAIKFKPTTHTAPLTHSRTQINKQANTDTKALMKTTDSRYKSNNNKQRSSAGWLENWTAAAMIDTILALRPAWPSISVL